MTPLPHRLDRTVLIRAARETVFSFFTDSSRWAAWWGAGSTIDARPGGKFLIKYPGGVEALGEVVEVRAPERIVLTYGYATGKPIAPGTSLATIDLDEEGDGTRLRFSHAFADAAVRDEHVQGWRYQFAVFRNAVLDLVHANAGEYADAWFAVWANPDAVAIGTTLARIATPDLRFRDRFSATDGTAELTPHILAAQRFMPGMRLERAGTPRHCQGTLLVDWIARSADDVERGRGTNVFTLAADGRIETATGFWGS